MNTPIGLIAFNRPEPTERVLEAIAAVKPSKLFIFADGPRPDRPDDIPKCEAVRSLVSRIDWECDLRTFFSDRNLGCKYGPLAGIDWLFEQVEEAIILEDDCLPHPSFFKFCEELLDRYRHDERVMMISGYNFFGRTPGQSYHFSYLGSTWGWATWRRAWRLNDPELTRWQQVVDSGVIENLFPDPAHIRFWHFIFDRILDGRMTDAWDYQWQLACWCNSGYRIFPATSLVSNIGFGDDATHTFGDVPFDNSVTEMKFPLDHPPLTVRCFDLDREITETFCRLEGFRTPPPPTGFEKFIARMRGLARHLISPAVK